ncbi:hypothetical protein BDZ45DRAFT_775930 [Acephala macrosclerotiorum]|nr:hypothetical protein BDZ45DRAFT_775930 [Acephala macrosclerotiorum]
MTAAQRKYSTHADANSGKRKASYAVQSVVLTDRGEGFLSNVSPELSGCARLWDLGNRCDDSRPSLLCLYLKLKDGSVEETSGEWQPSVPGGPHFDNSRAPIATKAGKCRPIPFVEWHPCDNLRNESIWGRLSSGLSAPSMAWVLARLPRCSRQLTLDDKLGSFRANLELTYSAVSPPATRQIDSLAELTSKTSTWLRPAFSPAAAAQPTDPAPQEGFFPLP